MPLISKPNYNQIFASQAPEQDKPAVFNNYPLGWGVESRPNNGKPTIKGFNYLHQTSDLKDLWILQNGACLPYDESIEYAEGAPVLKDGVIQYKTAGGFKSRDAVTIPTYNSAADGVDPVTGVADGAYYNVRSPDDDSFLVEYQNIGGVPAPSGKSYPSAGYVQAVANYTPLPFESNKSYSKGQRVQLTNGDIVRSMIPNNTGDPNFDMTGWVKANKVKTLKDFGGMGYSNNDTSSLLALIQNGETATIDTQESNINQTLITKPIIINALTDTRISDQSAQQHILYAGFPSGSAEEISGDLIEAVLISGLSFDYMPKSSADDFAAITFAQTHGALTAFTRFKEVENSISIQCTPSKYGKEGQGAKDSLVIGTHTLKSRRYVLQNIQGQFTRYIGNTAHNNGDNTYTPGGEVNNGGWNGGIRLAGLGRGNIIGLNNIRDRYTAIDFQRGQKYNVVAANYLENTFSNSVNASTTNLAAGGYHGLHGQMIVNAGATGVRLNYLGLIHGSASVHGASLYGLDTYPSIVGDEMFIVDFNSASGVVPANDSTLTQGAITCKLVQVRAENLSVVDAGSAMPTKGTMIIKSLSGRLSKNAPFSEVSATVTNIKVGEGNNLFDGIVSQSLNSGLRVGTNGNNLRFNINACEEHPAIISGNFNNIVLVISERVTGKYVQTTGNNNIVTIVDNSKNISDIAISITGANNTIIANTKGRISCAGSGNTLIVQTSRLAVNGNNNTCSGVADALINNGTGNNFRALKGGSSSGTVTLTTNSLGQVTLAHGLLLAATSLDVSVISSDTLLFATIVSIAPNSTTSTIQIWTAAGAKAGFGVDVTLSYDVKV